MMRAVGAGLVVALAASQGSLAAPLEASTSSYESMLHGQVDPTTGQTVSRDDNSKNFILRFDTSTNFNASNPLASTTTFSFEVDSWLATSSISTVVIGLVHPDLMCDAGVTTPDNCVVRPETGSTGPDAWQNYMSASARKLSVGFSTESTPRFCRVGVISNSCSSTATCAGLEDRFAAIDAERETFNDGFVKDVTSEVNFGSFSVQQNSNHRKYRFSITVPSDVFVFPSDGSDTTFYLGNDGTEKFLFYKAGNTNYLRTCGGGSIFSDTYFRDFSAIWRSRLAAGERTAHYFLKSFAPSAAPTAAPTSICPGWQHWEKCERINSWYKFDRNSRRRSMKQQNACRRNGCRWCGNGGPNGMACRPKLSEAGELLEPSRVCDTTEDRVRGGCDLFSECPSPEEMSACFFYNKDPAYDSHHNGVRRAGCDNELTARDTMEMAADPNGTPTTYSAGAKRCFYKNGICRAIGPYWEGRHTAGNIPGLFNNLLGCEYAHNGNTDPNQPPTPSR